jgi:hypothetical protein
VASINISADKLLSGEEITGWHVLNTDDGLEAGRLSLEIMFTPKGEAVTENKLEVDSAYFPVREGNRVILYQDADTPQLPQVRRI